MTNIAGQQVLHNIFIWLGRTTVGALFYAILRAAWLIAGKETGMGYVVAIIGILLAVLVVVCLGYFLYKKPDDPASDANPMSLALRRIVLLYLLLLGALLVALLIDLNMVNFPETAVSIDLTPPPATPTPAPAPTATPADKSSAASGADTTNPPKNQSQDSKATQNAPTDKNSNQPTILQVIPRATIGTAPTIYLAVYGQNLEKSKVRFNGRERPTVIMGPTLLEAQPETADIAGRGTIAVDVITDGRVSNAIVVPIDKPIAALNLGWWQPLITRETQLLLIVLLAGALGCLIHAMRSIADFIGNRTAVASWFWWYITRPLLGMSLALIFYAVLRGGFLAGTPADAKAISPFGVLAIGALVGMFSDKAAEKLAEIFSTLFQPKSEDARKDKLSSPTVAQLQPDTVKVGSVPVVLTIKGDHLEKIAKVKFDQQERNVKSSSAQQVTVDLQASDLTTARDIAITLVDSDNKTYPANVLHVVL